MKFKKKPVVIDAIQWDGTVEKATEIIDWVLKEGGTARYHDEKIDKYIAIDTIEGTMQAGLDWWVIKGVENEFYPCKPSVFEATYERTWE